MSKIISAMRGMRPAKNPKARSAFKPRQVRSRRDAEEIEFEDEDYEALEDCDGTEEGQVAELCKQPRVSFDLESLIFFGYQLGTPFKYIF